MNLSIVGCASLSHAKQSMPKRKSSLNLQSHKLWAYCQKLRSKLVAAFARSFHAIAWILFAKNIVLTVTTYLIQVSCVKYQSWFCKTKGGRGIKWR